MASKPMVPVEDYLRTKFEGPEPEYLDGELLERALPDNPHSATQMNLILGFAHLQIQGRIHIRPELRLRAAPARYRIADIAIFLEKPHESIPSSPPYITIEIVSPGDKFQDILEKCEEYRAWGVQHVWLVNPSSRTLFIYEDGLHDVARFQLPEFDLEITPEQVFG